MAQLKTQDTRQEGFFGQVRMIGSLIILMWSIEIFDRLVPTVQLQAYGIRPRDLDGLAGILSAPFLHGGWGHLLANTAPFFVLGLLVAIRGRAEFLKITFMIILVAGAATWVFARPPNHIASSPSSSRCSSVSFMAG
jgi:membrane associated rhomboid family serine protease